MFKIWKGVGVACIMKSFLNEMFASFIKARDFFFKAKSGGVKIIVKNNLV